MDYVEQQISNMRPIMKKKMGVGSIVDQNSDKKDGID